jgi:hypothetical protein
MRFKVYKETWNNRPFFLQLYIPSRTAIVLISEEKAVQY